MRQDNTSVSQRTTRHNVEAALSRFCLAHGYHLAEHYKDVGGYVLDYFDGYKVGQICSSSRDRDGYGVSFPFGTIRRKAADMASALDFAASVQWRKRNSEQSLKDAVLEWAKTPGNHGGNPYMHDFVKIAEAMS